MPENYCVGAGRATRDLYHYFSIPRNYYFSIYFIFLNFKLCVYVGGYEYVHISVDAQDLGKGFGSPGTGVTDSRELPVGAGN